ncbi:MAG: hypothetical protein J7J86_02610 [Bacteroidales bacterium]|nr:hypothetical protein [Bacteroidales bacterium]
MEEKDNIELRSEKVQNIIGQIPPRIIRKGISVIFLVVIVLLIGSYFFKYSYVVKSEIIFTKEKNKITGIIKIPANEVSKVKVGQRVVVKFNDIRYMNNEFFKSQIEAISKELKITNQGAFYYAKINIPNNMITNTGSKIVFSKKITGNAEIITDKISFFERIIQPIIFILSKKK